MACGLDEAAGGWAMKPVWCVIRRDPRNPQRCHTTIRCVIASRRPYRDNFRFVRTLCNEQVANPWGQDRCLPTCVDCLALLAKQQAVKG